MESILVATIVIAALLFLGQRTWHLLSGGKPSCASGCGKCSSAKSDVQLVTLDSPKASK